jgi:tetratricopeptide (TPR) repeat protein
MTEQEESAGGWNAKRFKYAAIIVGCVGLAGILNQFAPGPAAEDAYAHGNGALKDQKYQEAADAFSRVITLDPDNGPAYFGRALALRRLGQTDAAMTDYDTVVRLNPDDNAAHYNRGLIFTDLDKPDDALADFEAAAKLAPQDPDPHLRRAEIFRALGDFNGALAERSAVIELRGRRPEDYLARSKLYRDFGNLDGAIADIDTAINNSGTYDAYFNRGLLRSAKGDTGGALADFGQAITIKADDLRAYAARGATLLAAGRVDDAKAEFDSLVDRSPDQSPGYASRGILSMFVRGDAAAGVINLDAAVQKAIAWRDYSRLLDRGFEAVSERPNVTDPQSSRGSEVAPNVPFLPTIMYYYAWRHLAHHRAGQDDTFPADINGAASWTEAAFKPAERSLKRASWPTPMLALFAGKVRSDVVRHFAETEPAPAQRRQQLCEADFYTAALDLKASNAPDLLRAAIDECPQGAAEAVFAKAELQRLDTPHQE